MFSPVKLQNKLKRTLSAVAICLVVTGCSTASQTENTADVYDPYEGANRVVFGFNEVLDTWFLKPAATLYRGLVPPPAREGIHNLLSNLSTPVVLLNDILQGENERAEVTLNRFFINSTAGVLGIFDVAADMGYKEHSEDFGQTLAVWGVGDGPYIMLPIFGPSNARDTVGRVVDHFTDPVNAWANNTDREGIPIARGVMGAVDLRSRLYNEINDMKANSLDYYAAVRSFYSQNRVNEIRNTDELSAKPAPDLSFDFESPSVNDEEITEAR